MCIFSRTENKTKSFFTPKKGLGTDLYEKFEFIVSLAGTSLLFPRKVTRID